MRHHIRSLSLFVFLFALSACTGTPLNGAAAISPTPASPSIPKATLAPMPTPTPPAGFVFFTSHDHTYQIAYPVGWQVLIQPGAATVQFAGPNQIFDVSESGSAANSDPGQIVNSFCQAKQAGVAANPVQTSGARLGGQSWTRANCDAGAQGPAIDLIVEVVLYHGTTYQMDYTSSIVEFRADDTAYYTKMEQSFRFLV